MAFYTALLLCLPIVISPLFSYAQKIGVYYYPGWSTGTDQAAIVATSWVPGWAPIKSFKEREPLLGWYREGNVTVMTQQLDWMKRYGLDFVVFDWYWSKSNNKTNKEHAIKAYLKSPSRSKVSFSILWANHAGVPESSEQMLIIVKYWIDHYFHEPGYLYIDGKPVVFIFSANLFEKDTNGFNSDTKSQLTAIQTFSKKQGVKNGIYFVAGTKSEDQFASLQGLQSGYSAVSAYNYHAPPNGKQTTSYKELDSAYRAHWDRLINYTPLSVILPMTAGWDKRPWGGSNNPDHDFSIASLAEFQSHLSGAKAILSENNNSNIGVLCCWNEFGEGAFIEPTQKGRFLYLEQIRNVFKKYKNEEY